MDSESDLSHEVKMLYEELTEIKTLFEVMYSQKDIQEYFKSDGKDDVVRLKRSYDTHAVTILKNAVFRYKLDNILYFLFGETFFME